MANAHAEILEDGPSTTAAGDPAPVPATPLIMNDAYFELTGVNLRCLVKHLEVAPENKPATVTTFCSEVDYPSIVKWHLRVTFYQSFDNGAVYQTLQAALAAYQASSTPAAFKARPYASRVQASNNPEIDGLTIPMPFPIIMGDAGAASEVQIDWNLTAPPTVNTGAVPATGARRARRSTSRPPARPCRPTSPRSPAWSPRR